MPRNWDQHYSDPAYADAAPDALLVEVAEMLPPAHALDLACGAGRHALYLARQYATNAAAAGERRRGSGAERSQNVTGEPISYTLERETGVAQCS